MASAKQLKKLRETIKAIQAEQAAKPKPIIVGAGVGKSITLAASRIQYGVQTSNKPVANVKLDGKVIGQMKTMSVPLIVTPLFHNQEPSMPGFKSMGRGRVKNRMGLYNKIK